VIELVWPSVCAGCDARGEGLLCPSCRPRAPHRVSLDIAGVLGIWTGARYDGPLGRALRTAKYGARRPLAVEIAAAWAEALAPALRPARFDAIVPAPTVWNRTLGRGFSFSALMADELAARRVGPVRHALRIAPGDKQAGLSAPSRREALKGRVSVTEPCTGRLLLVDDVVTTGSTASACARELLCEGATEVWLATLCAVRPRATIES
jgi:predicted amidophosphoribosyltransferase